MKRTKLIGLLTMIACAALLFTTTGTVSASTIADGTYSMDYIIKKPEDESVSMANDYWEKPATVIIKDGSITVQTTMNHSHWVTVFKVASGGSFTDAKVVSENKSANTKVAQFSVESLDQAMLAQIHVTVPEIDYDHDYTIRFVFDVNSLNLISEPEPTAEPKATTEVAATAPVTTKQKPLTGAETSDGKQAVQSEKTANTKGDNAVSKEPTSKPAKLNEAAAAAEPAKASEKAAAPAATDAAKVDSATSTTAPVIGDDGVIEGKGGSAVAITESTEHTGSSFEKGESEPVDKEITKEKTAEEKGAAASDKELADDDEAASTSNQEVELAATLKGTVVDEAGSVVTASVESEAESTKKKGITVIAFLAVLLCAGAITASIYRKRRSNAA